MALVRIMKRQGEEWWGAAVNPKRPGATAAAAEAPVPSCVRASSRPACGRQAGTTQLRNEGMGIRAGIGVEAEG